MPNIARNAIINAAELASYDHLKEVHSNHILIHLMFAYFSATISYTVSLKLYHVQIILKLPGFTDTVLTHLIAGLGAGFFAVSIGSPVDVVKFPVPQYVKCVVK